MDGSSFPHNSFNTMINTNWLLHLNILFICQLCLDYDLTVSIMNVLQNNYQKMSTILHKYFTSFIARDSVFKLCKLWWQNLLWRKFFYIFLVSYFIIFFCKRNKQQKKKEDLWVKALGRKTIFCWVSFAESEATNDKSVK